MLIQRTAAWLLAWGALVLLATGAVAQVPSNSNLTYQTPQPSWENAGAAFAESAPPAHMPPLVPGPVGFETEADPFGPAETSSYGNGPRAKIGFWGSYERVFWALSKPSAASVGSSTASPLDQAFPLSADGPMVDNSFIAATGAWGNRWELGFVDTNNYGWQISVLDHVSQGQYRVVQNPVIRFDDPGGILQGFSFFPFAPPLGTQSVPVGEAPTAFAVMTMKNVTTLNGAEIMRSYRAPRLHNGGYFTLLYGVRWLQLADTFVVQGNGTANGQQFALTGFQTLSLINPNGTLNTASASYTSPINILDASMWGTRVINSMVGPQIGGRWEVQRGRWITSLETRFMAAANFQNARQATFLGSMTIQNQQEFESNFLVGFKGLGSDTHQFSTTIAPVGEIRVQTAFQITSNVALKVGYTGLYVGNISRASTRVDYSGPNLVSILPGGTHQIFFANGVNFGVEFNR